MYAGKVQGRVLNFDVYGVWRRNMLMRDRETGTIWQHATGVALIGPLVGVSLVPLGGTLTTWSAWRAEYPQTTRVEDAALYGLVPKRRLQAMLQIAHVLKVPGLTRYDLRLPAHEEIVGLVFKGEARAYSLSALKRLGRIEDKLAGIPITLTYESDKDRVFAFTSPDRQAALPFERQWWLGWSEFHPGSSIWDG